MSQMRMMPSHSSQGKEYSPSTISCTQLPAQRWMLFFSCCGLPPAAHPHLTHSPCSKGCGLIVDMLCRREELRLRPERLRKFLFKARACAADEGAHALLAKNATEFSACLRFREKVNPPLTASLLSCFLDLPTLHTANCLRGRRGRPEAACKEC